MKKRKVQFIINPISGVGKQHKVEKALPTQLDSTKFDYEIIYTQAPKHATELSTQAAKHFDVVVAIGGDGTVNEVSRGLINTPTALAIIPTGSGNGLARFLNIPMSLNGAIQVINRNNVKKIDTIDINDTAFVNMAGVGFDAHISHKFAAYGKRGVFSYLKLIALEFWRYKDKTYTLTIDGKAYTRKAFLISFANSSEFGNNAHIAPQAKIDDGLIDICILRRFPLIAAPVIALRLFLKNLNRSRYAEILQAKEITVKNGEDSIKAHIDGEPVVFNNQINMKIRPLNLNIITNS